MRQRALVLHVIVGGTPLVVFALGGFSRSESPHDPDLILHQADVRAGSLHAINEDQGIVPTMKLDATTPARGSFGTRLSAQ